MFHDENNNNYCLKIVGLGFKKLQYHFIIFSQVGADVRIHQNRHLNKCIYATLHSNELTQTPLNQSARYSYVYAYVCNYPL